MNILFNVVPVPIILYVVFKGRKKWSGWAVLERKYGTGEAPEMILGQPRFCRMTANTCAQKFDRALQLGASTNYLHLNVTCCKLGHQPLAIPWSRVADAGNRDLPCIGTVGRLNLDGGAGSPGGARLAFDLGLHGRVMEFKNTRGAPQVPMVVMGTLMPAATGAGVAVSPGPSVVVPVAPVAYAYAPAAASTTSSYSSAPAANNNVVLL